MIQDKARVLIVQDNEKDGDILKAIVETLGCVTDSAKNSSEASAILEHASPNLIIIDLGISEREGYATAQLARSNGYSNSLIPILFLMNSKDTDDGAASVEKWEATDSLRKPYYPFELISRCKSLLNLQQYEEQLEMAEQVLQSLALAVEARDPTTGNHCDRLHYRLARMADLLKMGKDAKDTLLKGAVLHDIGKVGVPDHILLKKGPLTDREWEVMRQHVLIGESLCRPLKFLNPVLPLIRHHHERFNGSGYPDGLSGDGIPLVARVFQVCDVFDALTNHRPYKPAFTKAESTEIMKSEMKNGWWDPGIVSIFLNLIESEPDF